MKTVEDPSEPLFHHYCAYPGRGGAGLAADRLVRGLRRAGCCATLYGLEVDEERPHCREVPDLEGRMDRLWRWWRAFQLERLPAGYRGTTPVGTPFFSDRSCHGLAMTKTFSDAGLLHFHWMCDFLDYADSLARVPAGIPVVWTLHDMTPFTGGCSYSLGCDGHKSDCSVCPHVLTPLAQREAARSHARKHKAMRSMRRRLVVVAPSRWLADEARASRIFQDVPCLTIPNGIDLKIFHPRLRAGARRSFDLEGPLPVLLFAASNVGNPLKSIRVLRQAMESACLNATNCRVIYVGEAPRHPLPDWWRWLGNLRTEAAMARCFAAADLTIVPSQADNFPNVVAESLASGTPVAASRVGGIPELVKDGGNGFLFDPADAVQLARQLERWLAFDSGERDQLRERARLSAEAGVDLKQVSQQYTELYRSLRAGDFPAHQVSG